MKYAFQRITIYNLTINLAIIQINRTATWAYNG